MQISCNTIVSIVSQERNDVLHATYMDRIGTIVTDMDQVMCLL